MALLLQKTLVLLTEFFDRVYQAAEESAKLGACRTYLVLVLP
jgi:hypothetical protein